MKTISDHYREQNRLFHVSEKERGKPWGMSGRKYYKSASEYAKELGATSILDYGCGQGTMKDCFDKFETGVYDFREYDPALPGKDTRPAAADFITCTDIMEHVELEYVDNVFKDIVELANKGAYFVISLVGSSEWLSDGTNAHRTVYPYEWWLERMEALGMKIDQHSYEVKRLFAWTKT